MDASSQESPVAFETNDFDEVKSTTSSPMPGPDPLAINEALEELRGNETNTTLATPPTKTRKSSIGPGYLHTLKEEERDKLYRLWSMLVAFFKLGGDVHNDYQSGKMASLAAQLSQQEELPDGLTTKEIEENPLAKLFFRQSFATDLDTLLLRFMRARKWSVVDTFVMVVESLIWRHEFGTDRLLLQGESLVKPELVRSGKGYIWSEDLEGRIVCYFRARLHDKNSQTIEESMDYTVWFLETGALLRRHDEQLVTAVVDLKDAGLASFDLTYLKTTLKCLQSFYPEILGQCLVINAPWIFWGFWAVVKSLLDPVVAAKVVFISPDELKDYINAENIPKEFPGGKSPFSFHYVEPSEEDLHRQKDCLVPAESETILELESNLTHLTMQINKLLNSDDASDYALYHPLMVERNQLKAHLRSECYQLISSVMTPTMYQRLGVVNKEGTIDWTLYKPREKDAEEARPSSTSTCSLGVQSSSARSVLSKASSSPSLGG